MMSTFAVFVWNDGSIGVMPEHAFCMLPANITEHIIFSAQVTAYTPYGALTFAPTALYDRAENARRLTILEGKPINPRQHFQRG